MPHPCPFYLSFRQLLRCRFSIVFITERLGESLAVMRRVLGLSAREVLMLLPKKPKDDFVIRTGPTPTVSLHVGVVPAWQCSKG